MVSTQAKEGQNCQNHDDEADEINQSVHEFPPCEPAQFLNRQSTATDEVPLALEKLAMLAHSFVRIAGSRGPTRSRR
jgi:hypothetical protein